MKKIFCPALLGLALLPLLALAQPVRPTLGSIVRHDPALDALLDPAARPEVIATGFDWAEGPVWDRAGNRLLWSDVPANTIYQWKAGEVGSSVFLQPSGFTGVPIANREPGSNGLAMDAAGRLLACEHGDRRVSVLTPGGGKMTVADRYAGQRFNSPNDLCVHSSGAIFFTDPPYGLPQGENDPLRETPWFGVYRVDPDGAVSLLSDQCVRPNGIALSPDEKTLYVAQSHRPEPVIFAWPLQPDLSLGPRRVFFDASELAKTHRGSLDGLKVDIHGNIWTTGPGGALILSPQGRLLGQILTGQATANLCWGEDGTVLFLTADHYILRLPTRSRGPGW